jgi:lipid A 3-O-deacylase
MLYSAHNGATCNPASMISVTKTLSFALSALVWLTAVAQSIETKTEDVGYIALIIENDNFGGDTDRHYTGGLRLDWMPKHQPSVLGLAGLMQRLMPDPEESNSRVYFSLGQDMHTPQNISTTELVTDDAPYAGWLYVTMGRMLNTPKYNDRFSLSLGVIGPGSLAGKLQVQWHDWFKLTVPEGWRNQLKNEPGIVLFYERRWKVPIWGNDNGFNALLAPHVNVSLGNVFTYAGAGFSFRFGRNVPHDSALPRVQPGMFGSADMDNQTMSAKFGWYIYVAVEGRAVARNIFLDGNSFRDSHSVDKKTFTGDVSVGFVTQLGPGSAVHPVWISYSFTWRSTEFHGQDGMDKYGSITVSTSY